MDAIMPRSFRSGAFLANLARIEFSSLKLVVACASVGSITHAAPRCNMSTMCASRRLQILEERLGLVLFYRRKSGLELTAAGRVVAEHSLRILNLLDEMVLSAKEAPQPIGEVFENSGRSSRGAKKVQGLGTSPAVCSMENSLQMSVYT